MATITTSGTVEVGTGTVFIETDWPNVEGLEAGTTKQTGDPNL